MCLDFISSHKTGDNAKKCEFIDQLVIIISPAKHSFRGGYTVFSMSAVCASFILCVIPSTFQGFSCMIQKFVPIFTVHHTLTIGQMHVWSENRTEDKK